MNKMEDKRTFTIVKVLKSGGVTKSEENIGGKFVSRTPVGAAKKAARRVCKASKIHGRCSLVVSVKETTRGSAGKTYTYKVKRELKPLKERTIVREGKKIPFKYNITAKAIKTKK